MIDTSSDQHRHRCEVRECIARGKAWALDKIKGSADRPGVLRRRGREAAERLWTDYKAQVEAGNLGVHGDWRDV